MAYHIYHTPALILGGLPSGEGDRLLHCYTRELGLVSVHAKSLRESRSRLRYALQTFAEAELDIIRGKHGWKLTSARPTRSFRDVWADPTKRRILARHASLMKRLIQGEERHAELFDDVCAGIGMLSLVTDRNELVTLELLLVVRLLAQLGYWGQSDAYPLLESPDAWSPLGLMYAETHRSALVGEVNRALRATQL